MGRVIVLDRGTIKAIHRLADLQGVSVETAIDRAVVTEEFVQAQLRAGGKILVQKPYEMFTEVVFPRV